MTGTLLLALGLASGSPPDTASEPAAVWRGGETYTAYAGRFTTRKKEWEMRDGMIDLRFVNAERGRAVMEAYRDVERQAVTPSGSRCSNAFRAARTRARRTSRASNPSP